MVRDHPAERLSRSTGRSRARPRPALGKLGWTRRCGRAYNPSSPSTNGPMPEGRRLPVYPCFLSPVRRNLIVATLLTTPTAKERSRGRAYFWAGICACLLGLALVVAQFSL